MKSNVPFFFVAMPPHVVHSSIGAPSIVTRPHSSCEDFILPLALSNDEEKEDAREEEEEEEEEEVEEEDEDEEEDEMTEEEE